MSDEIIRETQFEKDIRNELIEIKQQTEDLKIEINNSTPAMIG